MHLWPIDFSQGCQDDPLGKEQSFKQTVLGKLNIHQKKKKEVEQFLISHRKIKSKWVKDLNIRAETVKLQGKKLKVNLYDFQLSKGFLDVAPKVQATTEKSKINFMTINNIYVVNNTIKKVKI